MRFGSIRNSKAADPVDFKVIGAQAVIGDRVQLLYRNTLTSLVTAAAVALLFVVTQRHLDLPVAALWAWFAALLAVLVVRAAGLLAFHRHPDVLDWPQWLLLFRNGASVTAGIWGIAGLLFFPAGDSVAQAVTLMIVAGVAAGALSALAADYPSYRIYVVLTTLPLALNALLRGGTIQPVIGGLAILLALFLLRSGRQNSQSIIDALVLRHQNAALIEDLRAEKARVLNEAETMMGSVLSTAPIALWAIDNDARISFMEGKQLGHQTGQALPKVGQNLLELYAEHPQIRYATQRALAGEALNSEIELDGHTFEVHYNPMLDDHGTQQGAIGVAIDISDRIEHKKELSRRAHYDELTGLPNRTLILSQLEHAFDNARRHNRHVGLFFLDLDNFKGVNDTMGHSAGDELLRQAAQRLSKAVRQSDMPARLGGDEFLVVSEDLNVPSDAEVIAHKIARMFQRPFEIEQREFYATTSIGIAIYPQDGDKAETLMQSADTAMYHAKAAGKNKYRFFTRNMQDTAERHLAMETHLRQALQHNELHLMFQPKYDTHSGHIRGAEALLRWDSPILGKVTPDDFIPVAEFAGLMPDIGDWVLQTACREAATWRSPDGEPLHVAINVSPQQFRNTDLLANVTQALVDTNLPSERLELEITESVLVQDAPETMEVFKALNELGVTLSLDDFGTGYSSLSYLKKFPMQVLKIDKAFVQDLGSDRDDDSLVDAIVAMAHSLNMEVVAEGVETAQQLDYLRGLGVELVQGYYFSKPITAEAFRALLTVTNDHAEAAGAA